MLSLRCWVRVLRFVEIGSAVARHASSTMLHDLDNGVR